jgi:hypothetical protein
VVVCRASKAARRIAPVTLEETGVLRRTIGRSTRQPSLQPGLLAEAADWMDR